MVTLEAPNAEGWAQTAFNALLAFIAAVGGLMWKLTYGRMDKQISDLYKKANAYEKECGDCRKMNEKEFASKDDLTVIRQAHTEMLQHIDRRFDNLTAIIIGKIGA